MHVPLETLGSEITRLRTEAGLTLKDLAESVGCRSPYIEAIEDGRVEPSEDFVRKLAARLEAGGSLELFRRFRLQEDAAVSGEEIDEAQEQRIKQVIAAFGIALGVTFCGLLLLKGENAPLGAAVLGLPLFPAGLWRWLPILTENVAPSVLLLMSWIVYFGLGLVVVKARDRRARELSFTLFLVLLCGNVLGCWSALLVPIRE